MVLTIAGKNKSFEIDFPLNVSEVTYMEYCEIKATEGNYKREREAYLEDFKKHKEKGTEITAKNPTLRDRVINLVKIFAGENVKEMDDEVYFPTSLISTNFMFTVESLIAGETITIQKLYAHIIVLFASYTPNEIKENFRFSWKYEFGGKFQEEVFVIKETEVAKLMPYSKVKFTTGEAVTILELQKNLREAIEENPDVTGGFSFNVGLRSFATICRPEGVELPIHDSDRDEYLTKYAKVFEEIPMNIVLDAQFFFLHILTHSEKIRSMSTSSKVQKMKPRVRRIKMLTQ